MLTRSARIIFLFATLYVFNHASLINVGVVMAFRIQQQYQQQPSFLKIRSATITTISTNHIVVPSSVLYMAAGGRGMSKNAKSMNNEKVTTTGGMGMGSTTTTKSKDKKGTASSSSGSTPFNVNASLARLEKKYDELTKANAKIIRKKDDDDDDDDDKDDTTSASTDNSSSNNGDADDDDENKIVTSEYVVAIRAEGYVDDWVPIAQFCLTRTSKQASKSDGVTDPAIQAGVSYYCRELSHVATLGSRIFQSIPRNILQYSVETLDSFHKHVYETTISTNGGSSNKNDDPTNTNSMTKQDAREVLDLINGDADDKSAIKRAYRTKSFEYHPDRFIGIDRTTEEIEVAHNKYLRIQLAYDTLNSGIRSTNSTSSISWYQSLGGKARTDFVGPISLLPIETGKSILEMNQIESAITCMSPSIVQTFVARCK